MDLNGQRSFAEVMSYLFPNCLMCMSAFVDPKKWFARQKGRTCPKPGDISWTTKKQDSSRDVLFAHILSYSYGPLPVISTYNTIYGIYIPIYNQL